MREECSSKLRGSGFMPYRHLGFMLRHEPQDAFHINAHCLFIVYGEWGCLVHYKQEQAHIPLTKGCTDLVGFWSANKKEGGALRTSYLQNVETLSLPEM